jgi:hypothetical protein
MQQKGVTGCRRNGEKRMFKIRTLIVLSFAVVMYVYVLLLLSYRLAHIWRESKPETRHLGCHPISHEARHALSFGSGYVYEIRH